MEAQKKRKWRITALLTLVFTITSLIPSVAQNTVLKNNLLYDATLSFNLGVETKLAPHWSFEFNAGYNPWTFSHDKKWKHIMVSPQVRYWFKRKEEARHVDGDQRVRAHVIDKKTGTYFEQDRMLPISYDEPAHYFRGWFVGADLVYSHFNAGNVKFPFGMYKKVRNQRMQGNLYAVGLFGGYSWELNYRWNMSADLGLHVGWYDAKVYECGHCGTYKGKDDDSFLMPKLGVNIIYKFGKKPEKTIEPIKPVAPKPMEYMSYQKFLPALSKVEDNRGKAGVLELDNPVLQHISQYKPYVSSRILRKEKGALYVYFPLDKTELRRDFRDNAVTLDKIVSIVDEVLADTTSDVKIIQIVGMASIEGAESHNQQLGQGRADALKDYIINHSNATEPLFDVANGGEAWSEFRDQVNDESFDGKAEILAIIDGSDTPAAKERKIKALNGGKTYQYLKENILKDQRNSGYIRIYYDYVPDVNMGIIKEGIDLTVKKNYKQAIDLLKTVEQDPRALSPLGDAYFFSGDNEKALEYYLRGSQAGNATATDNYNRLKKVVEYNQKAREHNQKAWEYNKSIGKDIPMPNLE